MNSKKVFSFTKGYTFSFEEDGVTIDAWFSAITGLEKVFINGNLVSSQRNISTNSTNSFSIGENEYSTNLNAVSKNGKEYKRQNLVFPKAEESSKRLPFIVKFSFFIFLGICLGLARSFWQLPKESIYVFIVLIFVVVFMYYFRGYKGKEPVIESEEIV